MFLFPTWLLLSFLIGISSNAYNFLNRFLLKDGDDPTAYAWYNEILRFVVFGFFAIFNWQAVITPYSLLLFLLVGLTEFIGGYWYMKMHAYSHLSISSILYRSRLIWVALIAFLVTGEQLHLFGYLGIAIVFLGVSLTVAPKKIFIDKGAMYANLCAFIVAVNIVLVKMLTPFGSPVVINFAMALPSVILYPLFVRSSKTRMKTLLKTNIALKTFAVFLSIIQLFLFTLAVRIGDVSKVNAVYQGMIIFSVLAGIIFLKERENIAKKLIGATITIIGVVLLSFS
ncbi:MAG TPA: DMT family transporter [Methylomirabilota bacterium]|nr:DMT family transporter [Methylomirabilota bacterium]